MPSFVLVKCLYCVPVVDDFESLADVLGDEPRLAVNDDVAYFFSLVVEDSDCGGIVVAVVYSDFSFSRLISLNWF